MSARDRSDLDPWISDLVGTARSDIEGRGLFALAPLTQGVVVVRFGGYLLGSDARHDPKQVLPGTVVGVSEQVVLAEVAESAADESDFINHSCSPNLGMKDAVTLVTLTAVAAGAELTCDYAYWEIDPEYVMKQTCNCGSLRCRGVVTGRDWRSPDLRNRLVQWASPFVRRRIAVQDRFNES